MFFLMLPLFKKNDKEHGSHDKAQSLCIKGNDVSQKAAYGRAAYPVYMFKNDTQNMNQLLSIPFGIVAE